MLQTIWNSVDTAIPQIFDGLRACHKPLLKKCVLDLFDSGPWISKHIGVAFRKPI